MPEFVCARDFFVTLKPTERVFLLIRHSIRRHITPEDSDNGAHVGLTDEGRALAINLGKLFPAEGDAVYFSSPVGRCVDTAKCIAEGRSLVHAETFPEKCKADGIPSRASVEIVSDKLLGDFYVDDYDAYMKTLDDHFYQNICHWMGCGETRAFLPFHKRAEEFREYLFEKGTAKFNVFVTHDCWVVPTLTHFCGFRFTPSHWMNFLTGLAFVEGPRGERVVPVTGVDTGFLDF